jgi:hypothetical protein
MGVVPDSSGIHASDPSMDGSRQITACSDEHLAALRARYAAQGAPRCAGHAQHGELYGSRKTVVVIKLSKSVGRTATRAAEASCVGPDGRSKGVGCEKLSQVSVNSAEQMRTGRTLSDLSPARSWCVYRGQWRDRADTDCSDVPPWGMPHRWERARPACLRRAARDRWALRGRLTGPGPHMAKRERPPPDALTASLLLPAAPSPRIKSGEVG